MEYKQKEDSLDPYYLLGLTMDVCQKENCNEIIRKAYNKKAKLCHPDKNPGNKEYAQLFELFTTAYDIIKDEKLRNEYNNKKKIESLSSSDFLKLKKNTQDYMESIDYKPATDQQKISFKEKMKELDIKHGYDSSIEKAPISSQDAKKLMTEMYQKRSVQDVQYKPMKIFEEGECFNPEKFNAAFDIVHKAENTSLITHNGIPSAWNDMGSLVNYSQFDKLDNLYVEEQDRHDISKQNYSNLDFSEQIRKLSKEDVKNLKGADYVKGHNKLDDDYYKNMKDKLNNRKILTSEIENMKYNDFKRDDTAGYGIFDQLGLNFNDRLTLDVADDDINRRYEKIMAERQKELTSGPINSTDNIKMSSKKLSSR